MDDRGAIERLKQGDIGGLEALVRRYQLQAVRAAQLVTRDRGSAEDVVQTAFVRAYERIGQYDPDRPFGPWFLRSVVNDAVKAAARRARSVPLDSGGEGEATSLLMLLTDPAASPEVLLEQAENREAVRRALDLLAPGQRAAVVLRYYLGMTEAEIADQMGRPRGTVKRLLHNARARLKALIGGDVQPTESRTSISE
ncbi:MAG: sigma-70 family RNA polymerase sigma factor [Chloroflexi bacterium]|nr:sigma-70 family RNA polymerase sigma factor [Chloroflexota bacterium]